MYLFIFIFLGTGSFWFGFLAKLPFSVDQKKKKKNLALIEQIPSAYHVSGTVVLNATKKKVSSLFFFSVFTKSSL